MSVFGWKYSVWLPRLLSLHLPHRWRRMRACSHQTPRENLPSHRFPWRFSELILCQLVQLHVSSWDKGVWLARTCLLHGFLLLPHNVRSAVGLRGSGAEILDSCVSTAADDQLLQVGRPAAERAARMPTWKKLSSVLRRRRRTSVCGRKSRASEPRPLLLHLPFLLPHKVLRAVDPRARGAEIPDPCA